MDLNQIKKLIEEERAKLIIIEEGKPIMVILSFEDYQKTTQTKPESERKGELTENLLSSPKVENVEEKELTLDDLPF
jgi:PHD/YefM family antitoxin component YafN of YafNO toxin-antitoxin module